MIDIIRVTQTGNLLRASSMLLEICHDPRITIPASGAMSAALGYMSRRPEIPCNPSGIPKKTDSHLQPRYYPASCDLVGIKGRAAAWIYDLSRASIRTLGQRAARAAISPFAGEGPVHVEQNLAWGMNFCGLISVEVQISMTRAEPFARICMPASFVSSDFVCSSQAASGTSPCFTACCEASMPDRMK